MNMLIETLQNVGANPYSWAVVALIAAVALFSLFHWLRCPYLRHTREITAADSQAEIERPFIAGPRFVLAMLAGIGAIFAGLGMVLHQLYPPLALLLIVVGVFAVQMTPALLHIRSAVARVITAQREGPEAVAAAEERLPYAHIGVVTTSFVILFAVVLALLAF
jgi:hypothetical protein